MTYQSNVKPHKTSEAVDYAEIQLSIPIRMKKMNQIYKRSGGVSCVLNM